jgi:DNA-binding MarR family transcriptional regulator
MAGIMDDPFKSISILYRKSHMWLNDGCAQYALTAAQAVVILIVCDFKSLTQDEITKRLGLDKSVIAKTVTKMVEIGFLTRTQNAKDKRTYDIQPTEKAWAVYPFVKEQVDICFQRMTQQMSDAERGEFKRLLLLATAATLAQDDGTELF